MSFEIQRSVEELHSRYVHALDSDRLEDWPGFFTENATYRITTAENVERGLPLDVLFADSQAMLRDRVQSLRHANIYEPQRYRHIVCSTLVKDIGNGKVESTSNFLVIRVMQSGDTMLFASGRYVDRIVLAPAPRYEERIVICDSRRFDTLLAIPL
jgi:3-phenylpropionate/cinnamic acid dioxygenase small subunit